MPFAIGKEFRFEAAHRLHGHPKCGRLHGHSYRVVVELTADDLEDGMVVDYADLSRIKEYIDSHLDHRYLVSEELIRVVDMYERVNPEENAYLPVERTTAEMLAQYFHHMFREWYPSLTAVTVHETESTFAMYWED